jgi:hypothetical protein
MRQTVRSGLLTASLLASLAGVSSPAIGEDLAPPEDPSLAIPSGLGQDPELEKTRPRRPPQPTLATFSGVVTLGRRTRYPYTMVGTNPQLRGARNVDVAVKIIPMRMEFGDGTVLDPNLPDACMGGRTALDVTLQSPLFEDYDYGEGPMQFLEHVRRLEFWQFTAPGKLNPKYSVRLSPSVLPTQALALSPASVTQQVTCRATGAPQIMGHVDIDQFINYIEAQVVPQFPKLGVDPSTFVLFLLPFVDFIENGQPADYSFHAALTTPQGLVTFAAAQLGLSLPGNVVNIGPISHELAEWLDDPYIRNQTPAWGNTGQVTSGCNTVLEVGDPLTGTFLPSIQMPNGISYQPQETAFFSWFFNQVPSLGFDGWYSSGGTFKTPAGPCH